MLWATVRRKLSLNIPLPDAREVLYACGKMTPLLPEFKDYPRRKVVKSEPCVNSYDGRSLSQHVPAGALLGFSWMWQGPSSRQAFCTYTAADLPNVGNSALSHSVVLSKQRAIDLFWAREEYFIYC